MDSVILLSVLVGFIVFLITQFIVFRLSDSRALMKQLMVLFGFALMFSMVCFLVAMSFMFPDSERVILVEGLILSIILTGALCYFYVAGILGIMLTSLRVQMLTVLFLAGEHGVPYANIVRLYNREKIVDIRLDRLVGSSILVRDVGGRFRIRRSISPFFFLTYIQDWVWKFFAV